MRDPNRLDKFYTELCKIHKDVFPDLRFGQLISNFFLWLQNEEGVDFFFPEEDKILFYFKEFVQYSKQRKQ